MAHTLIANVLTVVQVEVGEGGEACQVAQPLARDAITALQAQQLQEACRGQPTQALVGDLCAVASTLQVELAQAREGCQVAKPAVSDLGRRGGNGMSVVCRWICRCLVMALWMVEWVDGVNFGLGFRKGGHRKSAD